MAKTFQLTVAKVGQNIFEGEVISASLPGASGKFEILSEHEPLITPLVKGEMRITAADQSTLSVEITEGGIAEVSNNQATILL